MYFGEPLSSVEVRILDRNAAALGIPTELLMENAGRAVVDAVESRIGSVKGRRVVVFAGAGGNAGDGITAARHFASRGAVVRLYLLSKPEELRPEASSLQYRAVHRTDLSIDVVLVREPADIPESVEGDIIVDALLGIGVRGRIRQPYARAIETINRSRGLKVAVDIPSGLDPDTGEELGPVVKANLTVTFHGPKKGMLRKPEYCGEIVTVSIGIPPEAWLYVGPGDVEYKVPRRGMRSHKGQAGRVLIVGGSETFTGAPALAALAALRSGVDLVFVAAPSRAADVIASYSPDLITVKLGGSDYLVPEHVDVLKPWIERVDVVALGMGLGLRGETREAVLRLVEECHAQGKKMVVDADGIKHLAAEPEVLSRISVITPHEGEYRRLFGKALPQDLLERGEAVRRTAEEFGTTILLKSYVDVVSDGRRLRFNKTGAPSMAVGGTGDILTGIVAAMLAKGLDPFNASCIAAFVNGLAGCLAYAEVGEGMKASDLLDRIPKAFGSPYDLFTKYLVYERVPR